MMYGFFFFSAQILSFVFSLKSKLQLSKMMNHIFSTQ